MLIDCLKAILCVAWKTVFSDWKLYFVAVFLDGIGIKLGLGFDAVGVLFDIGFFKWEDASWKESFADNSVPPFKDFSTSEANASILPSETFIKTYFLWT